MDDMTIIFLTCNLLPEKWAAFQLRHLLNSAGDSPIISISARPMTIGTNLIQTGPWSGWNINMQILRGCKIAKTKYIGIAEDDTLYTPEHYRKFRPKDDEVAFDMSRWSLFSWEPGFYHILNKHGTFAMIGPREYVITAYRERKDKFEGKLKPKIMGELGRRDVEKRLGISHINAVKYQSTNPIVNIAHPLGLHSKKPKPGRRRRHGRIKAYDIPYWGKSTDIAEVFNNGQKRNS